MSAEMLRRAAKRLREMAETTQKREPWCPERLYWATRHVRRNVYLDITCEEHDDETGHNNCASPGMYDGRYIALMHPPVALALATVLDETARYYDSTYDDRSAADRSEMDSTTVATIALARAILREEMS